MEHGRVGIFEEELFIFSFTIEDITFWEVKLACTILVFRCHTLHLNSKYLSSSVFALSEMYRMLCNWSFIYLQLRAAFTKKYGRKISFKKKPILETSNTGNSTNASSDIVLTETTVRRTLSLSLSLSLKIDYRL